MPGKVCPVNTAKESGELCVRDWVTKTPVLKQLPSWVLTLGIDVVDVGLLPLTAIPLIGEVVKVSVDLLQGVVAFALFDEPLLWGGVTAIEAAIPWVPNILPTYTLFYVARKWKKV